MKKKGIDRQNGGDKRSLRVFIGDIHIPTLDGMICMKYISLNRILLLAVGLWPYKRSKLIQLQLIFFRSIITSFIIFQFIPFVTSRCTPQVVLEILSIIMIFIVMLINYNCFYFNLDIVKHILELLQHIYDELRDEVEIAIIEKYSSIGRRYTEIFMLLSIGGLFCFNLATFLPRFLDIIWPANESRLYSSSLQIFAKYFDDPEKNFYLTAIHMSAAFCIGEIVLIATGTMFVVYLQHVCGILRIAGLMDILISAFNIMFFSIMVFGLLAASLNLFCEISSEFTMEKVIQSFIYLNIYYIYTYIANDIAQQVVDHNKYVFATVYNIQWYVAPLNVQKLILFLLQRGTKEFKIIIGGLFVGSLEGFATLASASISYFTVLYSMRKERINL